MSIKIDLKIFLFLLLFLITSQLEMYLLLMVFACIHELSHLFAGIILGFKPREIKITPVGLQVSFEIKCEEYNKKVRKGNILSLKKALIASAGPAINFLIAFVLLTLGIFNKINLNNIIYQNTIYANILIGLFNLIPIYPLDGGRILNEILHIFVGLKKSHKYTHIISKTVIILLTAIASIAILYLQNISVIIIIGYLWGLVIRENRVYQTRKEIEKIEYEIENEGVNLENTCKMNKSMVK